MSQFELILTSLVVVVLFFLWRLFVSVRALAKKTMFDPIKVFVRPNWKLILEDFFQMSEEEIAQLSEELQKPTEEFCAKFKCLDKVPTQAGISFVKKHFPSPLKFLYEPMQFTILNTRPMVVYNHMNHNFTSTIIHTEELYFLEEERIPNVLLSSTVPYLEICDSSEGYAISIFTFKSPKCNEDDGMTVIATIPASCVFPSSLPKTKDSRRLYAENLEKFDWKPFVSEFSPSFGGTEINHKYFKVTVLDNNY